jgi:hypothetical protein
MIGDTLLLPLLLRLTLLLSLDVEQDDSDMGLEDGNGVSELCGL